MQLLDSDQLEYAFAAHGISHDAEARHFYASLWDIIQKAEKIRDPLELSKIEGSLRRLCKSYFSLMRSWQDEERDHYEGESACAASKANVREAMTLLPLFEKQFTRYALCYLELNRNLIHMRVQLAHIARDYDLNDMSKHLNINHATGALLQRAHRERKAIMEKRLRLERAQAILAHFDPLMEFLGDALPRLLPQGEGDHELTLFKGALRKENFDEAERIAARWPQDGLRETGKAVVTLALHHLDDLKAQDGLLLHSGELTLITMFLKSDEARINQFMVKYNIPYMVFKYQNLIHQGCLLGRIGSIEGLIIQHARLLLLSVRPQTDAETAKSQERAVLIPARTLQNRFHTLGAIFDEMETTISILEKLMAQTRDYMAHAPENSQN